MGRSRLSLAILLTLTMSAPPAMLAAARDEPGWQVMMDVAGQGRVKGYLTKTRIVMDTGVFRSYLGFPKWDKIIITNPGNNTYFETTVEEWRNTHTESMDFQRAVQSSKKRAAGRQKIAGFDCQRYFLLNAKGKPWCEFFVTGKVQFDRRLEAAVSRLAMVPIGYGMPIEMHTLTAKGKPSTVITRIWQWKETRVKESELTPPRGLQKMDRLSDIWLSRDGKMDIGDIDDFFEYKFDKKK